MFTDYKPIVCAIWSWISGIFPSLPSLFDNLQKNQVIVLYIPNFQWLHHPGRRAGTLPVFCLMYIVYPMCQGWGHLIFFLSVIVAFYQYIRNNIFQSPWNIVSLKTMQWFSSPVHAISLSGTHSLSLVEWQDGQVTPFFFKFSFGTEKCKLN